ncbi:ATP-binding protein [Pseudomonas zeae]|uniref:ATP-binding protein n=1 Tax=Pseudomonas zeae TaxID=2745510 RepID=UPI0039E151B9
MAGVSTRFYRRADLTLQFVATHHQGRLAQYFSCIVQRAKLGGMDEIGYLPFGRDDANLSVSIIG